MRTISADFNRVKGPLHTAFRTCVGAGRANELLREDCLQHLRAVRQSCGFAYVRCHGIFHDDMGVYSVDRNGAPVYGWQYVDKVYDALVDIGMKPFVEFSFMPAPLASGPQTVFWWKGNVTPPNDYGKWAALIREFMVHCEARYGKQETLSWYYEVWNEPNLTDFWAGSMADYFKLYAVTVSAIKEVDPGYRVGGPATAGNAWAREFLDFCKANGLPADFASTHDYGVEGYLDQFGENKLRLKDARTALRDELREFCGHIKGLGYPGQEIHYTEWNSSYSPLDAVHDTYYNAAFVLEKIKETEGWVDSLSYWTFSDVFEEASPPKTPFHGGFGLINLQGLRKPTFFSYHYLNRLGGTELLNPDSRSWVCRDGSGMQALLWDFTFPEQDCANQDYFIRDLPAAGKEQAELVLSGLAPGAYTLRVHQTGYRRNDVYTAYHDLGRPAWLSRAQVRALADQSLDRPLLEQEVRLAAGQPFRKTFALRENDIFFVELRPAHGM